MNAKDKPLLDLAVKVVSDWLVNGGNVSTPTIVALQDQLVKMVQEPIITESPKTAFPDPDQDLYLISSYDHDGYSDWGEAHGLERAIELSCQEMVKQTNRNYSQHMRITLGAKSFLTVHPDAARDFLAKQESRRASG